MNTAHLKELMKFSKGLSFLYIEKNNLNQKQVSTFCSKFFDNFYQASTAVTGLQLYKIFKPEIVLMDLCFSDMNSLDLITQIKDINPKVLIISLSQKCDEYDLLEFIDVGLIRSLLKPLNLDLIVDVLTDATSSLYDEKKYQKCFKELVSLNSKEHKFLCMSKFHGMTIQNECKILELDDGLCKIRVPKMQILSLKEQSSSILKIDDTKYIYFYILNINEKELSVVLTKPRYIDIKTSEINEKHLAVNDSFKLGVSFRNKQLKVEAIDISKEFLSMTLYDIQTPIKIDDSVDITFGFQTKNFNSSVKTKQFHKIFSKATVTVLKPYKNRFKLCVKLDISKAKERIFFRYLEELESELIEALKSLIKKR